MSFYIHSKTVTRSVVGAVLLLAVLCIATGSRASFSESASSLPAISYPDFSSTDGLSLVGSASPVGGVLRLTPSSECCLGGGAWYSTKQPVQDGFQTTFQFQISDLIYCGGDGFAFVIQNTSDQTLGDAGCGIGYAGMPNSVAIEFDTFQNPPYCESVLDPNGNHISVHTNGTGGNSTEHAYSLGYATPGFALQDGLPHTVSVEYVPGTLSIYVDDMGTPLLTVDLDLATTLSLDSGSAWVGFVAGTGTSYENHDILNWEFSTGQVDLQIFCDGKGTPQEFGTLCEETLQIRGEVSGEGTPPDSIDVQITAMNTGRQTTWTLDHTTGNTYQADIPVDAVVSTLSGRTVAAVVYKDDDDSQDDPASSSGEYDDYRVAQDFMAILAPAGEEDHRLGIAFGDGWQGGDDPSTWTPPANLSFLRAAGFERIRITPAQGSPTPVWGFVKHQADVLLYIGHGWHDTNVINIDQYPYDEHPPSLAPTTIPTAIGSAWQDGLDTVLLYACSVSDIGDRNSWWSDGFMGISGSPSQHIRSPGIEWVGLGPTYWMGFQHVSPFVESPNSSVTDGRDVILNWAEEFDSGKDAASAWRIATRPLKQGWDDICTATCPYRTAVANDTSYYFYWHARENRPEIGYWEEVYEWYRIHKGYWRALVNPLSIFASYPGTPVPDQPLDALGSSGVAGTSAVDVHLYDPLGNHLGPDGMGSFETEIPGSSVYPSYLVGSIAPEGTDGQHLSILGADLDHAYNLQLAGIREDNVHFLLEVPDQANDQTYHVSYLTVPVTSVSVLSVTLAPGTDFTLALDADGDGVFEGQVPATGVTTTLDLPAGVIGDWTLDEITGTIVHDRTPNHNAGVLVGGPVWAQGYQKGGLVFDGVDDQIVISPSQSLNLLTTTLTLEAWILPDTADGNQALITRWSEDGQRSFQLTLDEGRLHAKLSPDGGAVVDLGVSSGEIAPGIWSHVAFASDGREAWYFVNGVQETISVTPPATIYTGTLPLTLGNSAGGMASTGFDGTLDLVKVYSGARTDYAPLEQMDWQGGPGQAVWSGGSPTRYDSASDGIDDAMLGLIRLKGTSMGGTVVYSPTGVLTSSVFDAGQPVYWTGVSWTTWITSGASLDLAVSFSDDGVTWTDWMTLTAQYDMGMSQVVFPQATMAQMARYQVRLNASPDKAQTPVLYDVKMSAQYDSGQGLTFLPLVMTE